MQLLNVASIKFKRISALRAKAKVHYSLKLPAGRDAWVRALSSACDLAKKQLPEGFRLIINISKKGQKLEGDLHLLGGEPLNAYLKKFVTAEVKAPDVRNQDKTQCFFCKVVNQEIQIDISEEYTDSNILVFKQGSDFSHADLNYILIPNQHYSKGAHWREFTDVTDSKFWGEIYDKLKIIINHEPGFKSFRVISNNGPFGGQTVPHLHFHLLANKKPFATPFTIDFKNLWWQKLKIRLAKPNQ